MLPRFAEALKEAGLNRINLSLDSLDEETFRKMNGRNKSVAGVLAGLEAALTGRATRQGQYVVEKGINEQDIVPMARYFRDLGITLSQPFCSDCHRARLSADGKIYKCLFSSVGTDFKKVLREGISKNDLVEKLGGLWMNREDRYSEIRNQIKTNEPKVEMSYIGG